MHNLWHAAWRIGKMDRYRNGSWHDDLLFDWQESGLWWLSLSESGPGTQRLGNIRYAIDHAEDVLVNELS